MPIPSQGQILVQPPGIEPGSTVLQTVAMTTSAKVAVVQNTSGVTTENQTQISRTTTYGFIIKLWSHPRCLCIGATGEIRTPNLKFRRLAFYPVELRSHCLVGDSGFKPEITESKSVVLSITLIPNMVENTGIEPVVPEGGGFTVHCITIDASSPKHTLSNVYSEAH